MAMAIQTLYDTGNEYPIPASYDGGCYQINKPDCVVNIGNNMQMNYSPDNLTVSFNAGSEAVIGGCFFKVTGLTSFDLVPNTTIYLCATIDTSQPNGQTGYFSQRTSSNIHNGSINGNDNIRDLLLYVVTTNGTGVTNVFDKRKIIGNSVFLTQTEYDALTSYDPYTFYYVVED